jgi:carboxyl-terminal processing protease
LRKLQVSPIALVAGALILSYGSFYTGSAMSGQVALPGLKTTRDVDFSSLGSLYGLLQRNFDGKVEDSKALDGAKAGLVASAGDPYTAYLTAEEAKKLKNDLAGKLSGIGAEIGLRNNIITVIYPVEGAPAEKAGLKSGDLIAGINDEDTTGMGVDTAVSKIRGTKGTSVKLKIIRAGTEEPLTITITRDDITVPSVRWSVKNNNVGYIKVSQFGPDTTGLVDRAATEVKQQGATRIILDVRNDPGGYLDVGVAVASQFLKAGQLVVEEKTGGQTTKRLTASDGGKLRGLPTVVLINGGSASASEIVAAALRDNNAAKLVGEKSYGKGSVQEIKKLPGGAELKVTVAHWYTPKGLNLGKSGIKPDTEVKLTNDDSNADRDPQLDKALELLK